MDLQSLRCCLSARGYSPTARSGEGNVPAMGSQPLLFSCELKVKPLMLQVNSHAVKPHHSHENAFTASPTKPVLTAGGEELRH